MISALLSEHSNILLVLPHKSACKTEHTLGPLPPGPLPDALALDLTRGPWASLCTPPEVAGSTVWNSALKFVQLKPWSRSLFLALDNGNVPRLNFASEMLLILNTEQWISSRMHHSDFPMFLYFVFEFCNTKMSFCMNSALHSLESLANFSLQQIITVLKAAETRVAIF